MAAAFSVQKDLGLDWYTNLTKLTTKFNNSSDPIPFQSHSTRKSICVVQCLREVFTNHWRTCIHTSPKLEFYCKIKSEFVAEWYLSHIKIPANRASVTRMRISSHNLYIERGRYVNPPIPRESRWCVYCYLQNNEKIVENEIHALFDCPLYQSIKEHVFGTQPTYPLEIENMFKCPDKLDTSQILLVGKFIHGILETNQNFTKYYKSQDFHSNTGQCVLL